MNFSEGYATLNWVARAKMNHLDHKRRLKSELNSIKRMHGASFFKHQFLEDDCIECDVGQPAY